MEKKSFIWITLLSGSVVTMPYYTYGKCPKISNTKWTDKMAYANTVDPDQTVLERAVWSRYRLFAIPLSILRNKFCIKRIISTKKVWNEVFEILGHLS